MAENSSLFSQRKASEDRLAVIVVAVTGSIFSLLYHLSLVYPVALITVLIAIAILFYLGATERISFLAALTGIVLISTAYRILIIGVTDGVLAPDPVWYAEQVDLVRATGHTDVIQSSFYQNASAFIVLLVLISDIVGVSVSTTFLVFSGLTGILFPLSASVLARRFSPTHRDQAGLVAAAIVSISYHSVYFSYYTIAQSVVIAPLLLLVLVLILMSDSAREPRNLILFLVISGFLLFGHKLAVAFIGVFAVAFAIGDLLSGKDARHMSFPVLFAALLFIIQYTVLTEGVGRIVGRLVPAILALFGDLSIQPPPDPTHAVATSERSLPSILERYANLFVLGIVSGGLWLYIAVKHRTKSWIQYLLAIAAFLVAGGAGSLVVSAQFTPSRFLVFSEIAMAIVIGVGVFLISRQSLPRRKPLTIGLVLFVLASQVVIIGAVPQDPRTADRFVQSPEQDALDHQRYFDQPVHSDYLYSHYGGFERVSESLVNADIPNEETNVVAYRPMQTIYRPPALRGDWKRQWNPEVALDVGCLRVYSNDWVIYYVCE